MTRIMLQTLVNRSCKLHLTTEQVIAAGVPEVLDFLGVGPEDWDPLGMHDPVTNVSRLTVPVGFAGRWTVAALVKFPSDGSGTRSMILYKNGVEVTSNKNSASVQGMSSVAANGHTLAAVGDYFEVEVNNNGMAAASILSGNAWVHAEYRGLS